MIKWISRVTRITDPLRLYGLIELLVAVAASLTPLAGHLPTDLWGNFPYHVKDHIWVQDLGYRFSQLAVAVICVFTPCFFMGTTFPLLSRGLLDAPEGQRLPAALYGWNTFGACAGVLACQFLLLPFIGGVFLLEAASVVLQVGSYKLRNGKRIFKMAPLHHHFELLGWSESKVIARFWIMALVFALFALTTLKLR